MPEADWITESGEGYPSPADLTYTVSLHVCQRCGRKAANPPSGNWHCTCGGETVVQEYTPTEYAELRKFGEVRSNV